MASDQGDPMRLIMPRPKEGKTKVWVPKGGQKKGSVDDNDVFLFPSARQLAQVEEGPSPVESSVND